MKGKETFALKRSPRGPFTVSTTKRKAPLNIWWPDITNAAEADYASKMGSGAAILIAVLNAIIATISVIISAPVFGIDASGYLNAALFALVAWGIRCRSSYAAMAGLGLFVLEKACQIGMQPKTLGSITMTLFLLCGFVSSVRGTRAYQRFEPEKAAEQAKPFIAVWRTPSICVTLVLGILMTFVGALSWLHILEALVRRSFDGPPVMTGNPGLYAVSVVALVSAAASIFAIIQRPRGGGKACALFSLAFAVLFLWRLVLVPPSTFGSEVLAWVISIAVLTTYVYAAFFGRGMRDYFASSGGPEVFKDRWPNDNPL